jgi:glutathione S-transferase
MKLYFKPGACSLAPHIVAREANLDLTLEKVDTKAQRTETGADYRAINPKGYVPAVRLDDGQVLTEVAVLVQYLADRKPEANLIAPAGTLERYRAQEWLNYTATELHKGFSPIFRATTDEGRDAAWAALQPKFDWLDAHLEKNDFLMGAAFRAPDAYLFTVLNWHRALKRDLAPWPRLGAYLERVKARPAVQQAMQAEGLKV